MNWAGPAYDDVGMELVDRLWRAGIPADLIPSSEAGHLGLSSEGYIHYGKQQYAALVLYYPEFENESLAEFFNRASGGETALFRMGDWTMDFEGNDFDGNKALPASMKEHEDLPALLSEIRHILDQSDIPLHTPATDSLVGFGYVSSSPGTTGTCYLIDGTMIRVAGTNQVSGDPLQEGMIIQGKNIEFDAVGLAAVHIGKDGNVEKLAAGGLKSFLADDLEISLDERMDLALWKNDKGKWEGVYQGPEDDVPPGLLELTSNWTKLDLPVPYTGQNPE